MPLYIGHTGKSYTISTDHKEAPAGSQIITGNQERFEMIMKKYSDNPNAIEKDSTYGVLAKEVKRKVLERVNTLLDEDEGCMTDINGINEE